MKKIELIIVIIVVILAGLVGWRIQNVKLPVEKNYLPMSVSFNGK